MRNVRDRTEINWKGRWMSGRSTSHYYNFHFPRIFKRESKGYACLLSFKWMHMLFCVYLPSFIYFFKNERAHYWNLLKMKWLTATTGLPTSRSKSVPLQNKAYHPVIHSVIISEKSLTLRHLLSNHISPNSELALKNAQPYPSVQLKLDAILAVQHQ